MKQRHLVAAVMGASLLGGCTTYGYGPPAGWHGEGWRRHVNRCLRHYPRYDPRTDLIERPESPVPCPLEPPLTGA